MSTIDDAFIQEMVEIALRVSIAIDGGDFPDVHTWLDYWREEKIEFDRAWDRWQHEVRYDTESDVGIRAYVDLLMEAADLLYVGVCLHIRELDAHLELLPATLDFYQLPIDAVKTVCRRKYSMRASGDRNPTKEFAACAHALGFGYWAGRWRNGSLAHTFSQHKKLVGVQEAYK